MPHIISPTKDTDTDRITELMCDGLVQKGIPDFTAASWPGLDTPKGRTVMVARNRFIKSILPDPSCFLKVVGETTGSIVAISICSYDLEPPKTCPPISGKWPTEEPREYAQELRNA